MQDLFVIKIGGNIIDDDKKLIAFLQQFAAVKGNKILVHGGGKLATRMADQLGIQQQMVDGRRITDAETLKIVTMVYAGYINKNIVARLQSFGCNAIGLTGADGNLIPAHKRVHATVDFGFVGDVESLQSSVGNWQLLLNNGFTPVIAPITHDAMGQLLNTNADTIAQEIAKSLAEFFNVQLIYSFEKRGVLLNINDENSVIGRMNPTDYSGLRQKGLIFAGMIPKLDNAFAALDSGVQKVIIGLAEELPALVTGDAGTTIVHD
jgi:acetylglutamate kinase